jgi:hypothetical protein
MIDVMREVDWLVVGWRLRARTHHTHGKDGHQWSNGLQPVDGNRLPAFAIAGWSRALIRPSATFSRSSREKGLDGRGFAGEVTAQANAQRARRQPATDNRQPSEAFRCRALGGGG